LEDDFHSVTLQAGEVLLYKEEGGGQAKRESADRAENSTVHLRGHKGGEPNFFTNIGGEGRLPGRESRGGGGRSGQGASKERKMTKGEGHINRKSLRAKEENSGRKGVPHAPLRNLRT